MRKETRAREDRIWRSRRAGMKVIGLSEWEKRRKGGRENAIGRDRRSGRRKLVKQVKEETRRKEEATDIREGSSRQNMGVEKVRETRFAKRRN